MSNVIGTGRFNRLLQRLLEIKADPPAPDVAGELMPTLTLESDRPEWAYLKGERLMVAPIVVTAAAANPSRYRVRNPSTSNGLVVVKAIIISGDTTDNYRLRRNADGAADLGTIQATRPVDTRLASQSGFAIASFENAGAADSGSLIGDVRLLANSPFTYREPIVIGPNGSIDIRSGANNVDLRGSVWYSERGLEASEQ